MSPPSPIPAARQPDPVDRATLRRHLLETRRQLEQRPARDHSLGLALERSLLRLRPRCIGAYCAIRGEFDPLPLLQRLGLSIALPRVEREARRMEFAVWQPGQALHPGAYGIAEPGPDATVVDPDLLLLPCVGFASNGLRLGYGGGYYDRYLARRDAVFTIGLAYDALQVGHAQPEPHDRLLDLILTESAAFGRDAGLLPDAT